MECMHFPLDIVAFVCLNKIFESYFESSAFSQNPFWSKRRQHSQRFPGTRSITPSLSAPTASILLGHEHLAWERIPFKAGEHHLRIVLRPCEVIAHTSIPSTAKSGRSGRVPERTVQLFHCWYITLGEPPFVLFNVLQFAYREFHKRVICLKQAITHIDIMPHISLTIEYVLT